MLRDPAFILLIYYAGSHPVVRISFAMKTPLRAEKISAVVLIHLTRVKLISAFWRGPYAASVALKVLQMFRFQSSADKKEYIDLSDREKKFLALLVRANHIGLLAG